MLYISLFALAEIFQCESGFHEDKTLRQRAPMTLQSLDMQTMGTSNRAPIRIYFDTRSLDTPSSDPNSCQNSAMECTSSNILDSSHISVVETTIHNVESILESYINVTRLTSAIDLSSTTFDGYSFVNTSINETDLFVCVLLRNFSSSSSGLAYATTIDVDSTGRSDIGEIVINPAKVPDEAQNLSSGNRQFFLTIMHEINHVLCFSQSLFSSWLDSNGTVYSSAMVSTGDSTYGINHYYLRTPNLESWVNDRFSATSSSTINIGLELEDGGGSGTAISHPNLRLYFTDLMQGRTYGPGYVSKIFYYSLLDSGWYTPDATFYEQLVYLDCSLDPLAVVNEDMLIDPPRSSFPSAFLCNDNSYTTCFYDYSYKGICGLASSSTLSSYNSSVQSWYNPTGASYIGQDELLDYTPIILPSTDCRDSSVTIDYGSESASYYAETLGDSSVCALSTLYKGSFGMSTSLAGRCIPSWCGSDNKIRFVINSVTYLCKTDNEKIQVSGYNGYIYCPYESMACANRDKVELLNILSITPDRGPIDGQNLVAINGFGFDNYNLTDLILYVGPVKCEPVQKTDSYILCQLDTVSTSARSALLNNPQSLIGSVNNSNLNTTELTDMYTFTNRYYDAGVFGAVPDAILIALALTVSLFF